MGKRSPPERCAGSPLGWGELEMQSSPDGGATAGVCSTTAQMISSNCSIHGFFGRHGGVSRGVYNSLNCSQYVGDDGACVAHNCNVVKKYMNAEKLITLNQCHGNVCIHVDESTASGIEADAMVTQSTAIALCVLTADCAPILFWDDENAIVAAAHAGWRGAVSGIIEATLEKMLAVGGGDSANIVAAIGPCIGVASYEVGDDFERNISDGTDCFRLLNEKKHFDLSKYCVKRLLMAGLQSKNVKVSSPYTVADHENYFSYRMATRNTDGICGRNASAILLKPRNA
jgi:YfiH family protein